MQLCRIDRTVSEFEQTVVRAVPEPIKRKDSSSGGLFVIGVQNLAGPVEQNPTRIGSRRFFGKCKSRRYCRHLFDERCPPEMSVRTLMSSVLPVRRPDS